MATLVCFHAHPDDESIITAGLMARAAERGHRVVLVVATRGEHGEVVPGVLGEGEQLGVRRVAETFASADVLGVARVELLGYVDSEMMGEPENDAPYSFWSADVDAAAGRPSDSGSTFDVGSSRINIGGWAIRARAKASLCR
jgi:LmbE family N-acetylglucosaminyl deacetylase